MARSLQWKTNFWGTEYKVFDGKLIAGMLKASSWNFNAYCELRGTMFRFDGQGFWKPFTRILDIEGQRELGRIDYHSWKQKAIVHLGGKEFTWETIGFWGKKWRVTDGEEEVIFERANLWKVEGEISGDTLRSDLIITGLFIYHIFKRRTAAAVGAS